MSNSNETILILISRLRNTLFRKSGELFRKYGVTFSQFEILEVLWHDGNMTVGSLQKKILGTAGNIPVVVNNLITHGYCTKEKDKADQRKSIISITQKGRELAERIYGEEKKLLDEIFSDIEENKKKEIVKSLFYLRNHIK